MWSRFKYEVYCHLKTRYIGFLVITAILVAMSVVNAIVEKEAADEIFVFVSGVALVIWLAYALVTIWRKRPKKND